MYRTECPTVDPFPLKTLREHPAKNNLPGRSPANILVGKNENLQI